MNNKSSFPIKSPTACLLKWGWSTLFLYTGQSNSCHRTTLSNMTAENIGEFHNTPAKIQQREIMLKGEWPERGNGCEYCRDIEDAGGISDRLRNLELLAHDEEQRKLIPLELFENPTALEVTPTILEVYFTNRCNMACVYCGPNYSTKWVAENEIFGTQPHHFNSVNSETAKILDKDYDNKLNNFWKWLEKNYGSLKMFHVLGGEPFYQKETEETIKFWYDHPNPDLHLKIFSNLKVGKEKFKYLMGELKKLSDGKKCKSVGIIASLDGFAPDQEYVRWGLNLNNWRENFEHLIYEHTWASVSINSTINALSIKSMPALVRLSKFWDEERQKISPDGNNGSQFSLVFNMLLGPPFMNASIFPSNFFDAEFEEIISLLPDRNNWEKGNIEYMKGIQKNINSTPHNPTLINSLKLYLDEIDRRRKTNWRDVFPWLVKVN